ncbi:polysaccharide pyruvyl transferase family protein [Pseudoalteromonas agarivorans]|uniref:polysaccharide pyruvyl transferase family protein n=1 Tax=Pseudoalteromonas agarivorans TaxID=176102 RepID=UPI0021199796|nr:polysaccharide pyruvyl transferase family protein [Pseudoalteromonas agarivorans]MCQ8822189.1 polysaccharide pyruvyl transferase family protein [Pseudoalteromonas agarivorans]
MKVGYLIFNSSGEQDYCGTADSSFLNYEEIKKLTSNNTGNLMFKYAARRLFKNDVFYIKYSDDPDLIRDKFDVLVLPEANLINPSVNYAKQASFVAKLDKPTLLLGVGAQAKDIVGAEEFPPIPEGTISFLKEVSKRTPNIFCRGEFTKSIIKSMGIDNVLAIGCPTFMINPTNTLWENILSKPQGNILKKLSVTEGVYPVVKRTDSLNNTERFLFDQVLYNDAHYVAQCQISVLKIGFGLEEEVERNNLNNLRRYLAPHSDLDKFSNKLLLNSRSFSRVDNWLNYARSRTGFCGTRIHGNMVAIQSAVPSLPVAHDSRTKELCQIMRLPFITPENFDDIRSKSDLIAAYDVVYDSNANDLDAFRSEVAKIYIEHIEMLGLNPSNNLLNVVK